MKKDLLMEARSPDPDDLANEAPVVMPESNREDRRSRKSHIDHSAPHIPPLEKGRIRGEE